MVQNWVIAILAVIYVFIKKYSYAQEHGMIDTKKKMANWLRHKADDFCLSILAVIILMMVLMNEEALVWFSKNVINLGEGFTYILWTKLGSAIIGFLNTWIVELLLKTAKRKLKRKADGA